MSNLSNQLAAAERHEVARGIRLLLANPLITERSDAESFELVRRRQDLLTKWFDYYCGWSLTVESRLGYARLTKVRTAADGTRPARRSRSGRAAFDRRRYTLLCVVAAELLTKPVTTIGLLASQVAQATAADAAIPNFDSAQKADRRAFVDALRLLESYGAIEVVDGSTETFVDSDEAKVLYRVDTTLLMRLLSAPSGASRLTAPVEEIPERFDELLAAITVEQRYGPRLTSDGEYDAATENQRNLWLRHSIFRRLLDEPVVYRDELTEAQLSYLNSPTGRQMLRRAGTEAGFVVEERAEGWLFVDTDAIATDSKFPDDSSNAKVAALLLLELITAASGGITAEQLRPEAEALLRKFPRWAQTYRSDDGTDRLVADAVAVLEQFGLVWRIGGLIRARPAAARYRVTSARTSEDTTATGDNSRV